jgi:hypothetical protein
MNLKDKIHTNRFKELNKEKDNFINARITTPQTYDEIKSKGTTTILKIASKGIVEKLLQRCEHYKAIINKKTETIKSKNELIGLLAARLQHHEPELFNNDFKQHAEAVENAKKEEVNTPEKENKEELNPEEKEQLKADNEKHEKETDPDYLDDPDTEDPESDPDICKTCGKENCDIDHDEDDIDDAPRGSECGEGGDIDDEETDEQEEKETEIIEEKETKK